MKETSPTPQTTGVTVYLQDQYFAPQHQDCPLDEKTLSDYAQRWLESLSQESAEGILGYELSLRLTGDREIQKLNAQYRQQDKATDVLAFAEIDVDFPDIAVFSEDEPLYLGDIAISVETAQKQADEQQERALRVELLWLFAHGLLHLLGWDHPTEERLQEMLIQQEQFLQQVGIPLAWEF